MNALTRVLHRLVPKALLSPVSGTNSWWWPRVLEPYAGAWQQNVTIDRTIVAAYWAVFACVTLIAKDISKLMPTVMQKVGKIFEADEKDPLNALLKKPNHYQTRLEFLFMWVVSELLWGNTYVLKRRDENGKVDALYILDPCRVTVLVSDDGGVYYQLSTDNLSEIQETTITVPASEIIHDRMYTLYHPLVGVSPIFACGIAAMQGNAIMQNSATFFANMSRPSGLLTAPGAISDTVAARLKTTWETNYSGVNMGRVAVLGDGLKYEAMTVNAHDSQLIEQLKMSGEMVAACYHVPGYKIGVGNAPSVNNTASLNQQYYDQCLQYIIEKLELRLDEGLEVEPPREVWLDLTGLLRMDPQSRYEAHSKAISGGWLSPNEARREEDLPPVEGGDTPYLQQQNYSLAALAKRDAQGPPPASPPITGQQAGAVRDLMESISQGKISVGASRLMLKLLAPNVSEDQIGIITAGAEKKDPITEEDDDEDGALDEGWIQTHVKGQLTETTHV